LSIQGGCEAAENAWCSRKEHDSTLLATFILFLAGNVHKAQLCQIL